MKTLLTLTLGFAALALSPAPAPAQSEPTRPEPTRPEPANRQLVVSYADLDLATGRGVRILDRRLRAASAAACGLTSDADPAGKNAARACRTEALALARAQRDSAIVDLARSGQTEVASNR